VEEGGSRSKAGLDKSGRPCRKNKLKGKTTVCVTQMVQ
jgi:hypothetical protein